MNTISIKGQVFPTEVAITEQQQRQGLMFREYPTPIMCFPYKNSGYHKFWMKNTISPLDIIFCKANQIIGIFKGEPLSTTLIGPDSPSDLVVELPAGMAGQLNLQVGDYVGFSHTS